VRDRGAKKFVDWDAVTAADEQQAIRFEGGVKGLRAGQRIGGAAAFDFDSGKVPAGAHDKIDFLVAFTPIEEFALLDGGGVGQVRADR